jgi:hypothetical protein
MDDPTDLSSQDRPGWYLLDKCASTRNRKVVGSNPTSGSQSSRSEGISGIADGGVYPAGSSEREPGDDNGVRTRPVSAVVPASSPK